jgi:hypothetical protein
MQNLKVHSESAIAHLKSFYPNAQNVLVDELEVSADRKMCSLTLSYDVEPNTPSELLSVKKTTCYKVFQIEIKTGELLSMMNREDY